MVAIAPNPGMVYDGRVKAWVKAPAYLKAARAASCAKRARPAKGQTSDKDGCVKVSPYPRIPLNAPHAIPAHQVDLSVSGLGAYRAYRSHQGKHFPMVCLTMTIDTDTEPTATAPRLHDSL